MPIRQHRTSGAKAGQGNSKRLYVGREGSYDFDSLIQFTLDWANVGKIVSAVLNIYTDDGLGDIPSTLTKHPRILIRRLTSSWTEGDAPDGTWQANDYDTATYTTSDQISPRITREELGLNALDITAIVEDWAPKTVKRRNGTAGGAAANHGLFLIGTDDFDERAGLVSEDWTEPTLRPVIVLTYEFGRTTPNVPTNLTPSGSVASFDAFAGDFSDPRPTDTLRSTQVQLFDGGHSATGTAVDNVITDPGHGLVDGDLIYWTSLTGGDPLETFTAYYVQRLSSSTFWLSATPGGLVVNVTADLTAGTWSKKLYDRAKAASNTEILADHFTHVPDDLHLNTNTNYRWRVRARDNEGQDSTFTSLATFSVTNTDPDPPGLSPVDASSFATLDGVLFRGQFTDDDAGDYLLAYQVQMSAYPEGDSHWDDDQYNLWNTGKRYTATGLPPVRFITDQPGVTVNRQSFETPYGGDALVAGTYHWRARVWDNHQGISSWAYASITVTENFEPEPDGTQTAIQLRPRAPWRIVIRDMYQADGVTKTTGRGPGRIVAIIEDAKNVGASTLYNSPGEAHWTLGISHPQLDVIEPKQTHYSIQFRQGDGWRETYAGLVDDFDATDTDVIFYGIDYLGLLDRTLDERYDPANPDKPVESGGSKYVTTGFNSINYIVTDQLTHAKNLANSPVGFITVGAIATMTETLTVYSTYAPTLTFVTGLLDSHRQGTGKRTRLQVRQKTGGGYEFAVIDDPGQVRDNLRLRYGELVQGYRVVPFGKDWSSRVSGIGRDKTGVKVQYTTQTAPGIDEAVWGRFAQVQLIDGISDTNDLIRRTKQAALHAGKLGNQIGLGIRSGVLQPFDGYDVTDQFPIDIVHGSVNTGNFGSGYWVAVGVTWTVDEKTGKQDTILTFTPREDSTAPDTDLLVAQPISPQAIWQVGWKPPDPTAFLQVLIAMDTGLLMDDDLLMDSNAVLQTGRIYIDITTGSVYELSGDGTTWNLIMSPPTPAMPVSMGVTSRAYTNNVGIDVVNISVEVEQ